MHSCIVYSISFIWWFWVLVFKCWFWINFPTTIQAQILHLTLTISTNWFPRFSLYCIFKEKLVLTKSYRRQKDFITCLVQHCRCCLILTPFEELLFILAFICFLLELLPLGFGLDYFFVGTFRGRSNLEITSLGIQDFFGPWSLEKDTRREGETHLEKRRTNLIVLQLF